MALAGLRHVTGMKDGGESHTNLRESADVCLEV